MDIYIHIHIYVCIYIYIYDYLSSQFNKVLTEPTI